MRIQLSQLFIYELAQPASLRRFVEFWSSRYYFKEEALYDDNINGPHTPECLRELFRWKITQNRFMKKQLADVHRDFFCRIDEVQPLLKELSAHQGSDFAKAFLEHFDGGPIYRIFWLHCWKPQFPIFDQHVFRAMTFIEDGEAKELPSSPRKKISLYLERYLPFHRNFDGIDARKVDQALWTFGKCLKDRSLPPLRS